MNFVDYFYGGGEGRVLIGRKKFVIFWGYFVFGRRIRKRKKYSEILIFCCCSK
ncbi:hypothetical protein [Escherichia coli]